MRISLGMQQASWTGAPPVARAVVLKGIDDALAIAGHVEFELLPVEQLMFRIMVFGGVVDLPYKDMEDLRRLRDQVTRAPGEHITPALAAETRPELAAVLDNSERFAPLTAEAANFVKWVVLALNLLGGGLLLATFWAIRRSVLAPLNEAVAVAGRIAQGDLSCRVAADADDEMGRLMQALAHMQASLGGMSRTCAAAPSACRRPAATSRGGTGSSASGRRSRRARGRKPPPPWRNSGPPCARTRAAHSRHASSPRVLPTSRSAAGRQCRAWWRPCAA